MKSKISQILSDISIKKEELIKEYELLKEKYGFNIVKWKIVFKSDVALKNKKSKTGTLNYIISAQIRHIISASFIYMMVVPAAFLDFFLFVYQNICFRLYDIPLVKRSDYIVYDRKQLDYLNSIQKFNCIYCSYVNWLFSFATEVWWRTEKYWCPIKHARKMKWWHDWQEHFADYGDIEWFKEVFKSNKEFHDKNIKK